MMGPGTTSRGQAKAGEVLMSNDQTTGMLCDKPHCPHVLELDPSLETTKARGVALEAGWELSTSHVDDRSPEHDRPADRRHVGASGTPRRSHMQSRDGE